MSDSFRRVLTSCVTMAIVIGLFLGLLFIIGASIVLFATKVAGL